MNKRRANSGCRGPPPPHRVPRPSPCIGQTSFPCDAWLRAQTMVAPAARTMTAHAMITPPPIPSPKGRG
eukprot:6618007-Alexandrium_andersonii.AAC.1